MYFKKVERVIGIFLGLLLFSLPLVHAETTTYDLTYDQVGNLQQSFDKYIEYNEFNQVVRVREHNAQGQILEEYVYDENGERLMKYEPLLNQSTYYISDDFVEVVNATGSYLTVYYHEGDTLVGRKDPDGRTFFYHPDHLGSTTLVTNESGNVVEETTYEPYGEVIEGGDSRFLFTSKELDANTDMYYYGARYYDPFFTRFTQPDQNIPDVYDPQSLNRYSYVLNNPYKYVDPSGEIPVLVVTGLIGAGISASISAYSQYHATGSVSFKQTAIAAGGGFVAGATGYGIGALAGSTFGALAGGAIGGVAGGEAGTFTGSVLSGQAYSFDPARAALNAVIGGVSSGIGSRLAGTKTQKFSDLPKEAQQTFNLIDEGKTGSLGSHTFKNEPVNGKYLLPQQKDPKYYTTHYLQNIGKDNLQRVVTGKKGERYYTRDHYKTFYKVRKNK